METLMILSIALIIGLITLGVMVFAYKASPTQPERGDQSQLSPSHGRQKRGRSANAHFREVGTRGRHGVVNEDIQPIASDETEEGRTMNPRVEIDLRAGL